MLSATLVPTEHQQQQQQQQYQQQEYQQYQQSQYVQEPYQQVTQQYTSSRQYPQQHACHASPQTFMNVGVDNSQQEFVDSRGPPPPYEHAVAQRKQ
ncbi:hypothetical protein SPI_03903 [Niveomyces insectorum RCEF 264]|uniref:Uncharacterized protein n=1 Tax=Niveomyces insectorum RCEF 264 TaxID=1081102 RepID=A0A162MLG5_9HYPO|nr:hypothetical protein SPI_03903 [Niveomyces insectorum RCEF 264]